MLRTKPLDLPQLRGSHQLMAPPLASGSAREAVRRAASRSRARSTSIEIAVPEYRTYRLSPTQSIRSSLVLSTWIRAPVAESVFSLIAVRVERCTCVAGPAGGFRFAFMSIHLSNSENVVEATLKTAAESIVSSDYLRRCEGKLAGGRFPKSEGDGNLETCSPGVLALSAQDGIDQRLREAHFASPACDTDAMVDEALPSSAKAILSLGVRPRGRGVRNSTSVLDGQVGFA